MSEFLSLLAGTVIRPRRTFDRLASDPKKLRYGAGAVVLIAGLYTLTVTGLAATQARISAPAFLPIPESRYYFWESFFSAPIVLAAWILGAGLMQFLSRNMKGQGDYAATLAVLGFAWAVPMFITWIPETVGTLMALTGAFSQAQWIHLTSRPGFWRMFAQTYQLVALAWFAVLFPVAAAASQKLFWWQAAPVGLLTLSGMLLFLLVFIR